MRENFRWIYVGVGAVIILLVCSLLYLSNINRKKSFESIEETSFNVKKRDHEVLAPSNLKVQPQIIEGEAANQEELLVF